MADIIFTVTVPGGTIGGYYIDGVQKPIISVVTGGTFRFNQNDASNATHPLALSTTTSIAGRITTGVVYYLDGVTTQADYYNTSLFNAATVRYIEITVTQTSDFYYICNVHGSGMGNVMDLTVDSWGALNWSEGEWGHQPADISIEVTTPGVVPTTWGQSTYGNYAWGQITGTEFQIGDESIFNEQNALFTASTNFLALTVTNLTITGDANLTLSTNLLNTTIGFISEEVNTIVQVNPPGDLPWGATAWGNGSWGNIGGMLISQGAEEEVVPSVEVNITGNALIFTLTSIAQITGDANVTPNTNILTVSLGNEDATPNTQVTLSTNLLNISMGFASGETLSTISVTGVQVSSQTGRLFITAWAVVDIGVTNNWSVVDIAA